MLYHKGNLIKFVFCFIIVFINFIYTLYIIIIYDDDGLASTDSLYYKQQHYECMYDDQKPIVHGSCEHTSNKKFNTKNKAYELNSNYPMAVSTRHP